MREKNRITLRETAGLSTRQVYEATTLIRDSILNGVSKKEIVEILSSTYKIKDLSICERLYNKGTDFFLKKAISVEDQETVISQHIQIYEELYKIIDDYGPRALKIQILQYKERLLGFHTTQNVFEILQENITVNETPSRYKLEKLTEVEQNRLQELLQKVKKK